MSDSPSVASPPRLFFLDNLRVWLTIFVVLHHLSVIYAGNNSFYYLEPTKSLLSIVVLVFFQLLNQAYFMGLFFFLAGYFTPDSCDRKGAGKFLTDRLLRLGIPLLFFYFVLSAVASIAFYQMPASLTGATTFSWRMGVGPLWFVVMLLVFDLCYFLLRLLTRNRPKKPAPAAAAPPPAWAIPLFIVALAIVSYLLRIVVPFAKYVLFFPSLAYLPQYISFFVLGMMASRHGWLQSLPSKYGRNGMIAAVLSLFLFLVAISAKFGSPSAYLGHGTWQSALYALWDSIFSVGLGLGLLVWFRRFGNHQKSFGRSLQQSSFTVYIIHCPIIALIAAFLLRDLHLFPLLKFALAAVISVPVCFAAAYLLRKIPYASKILG